MKKHIWLLIALISFGGCNREDMLEIPKISTTNVANFGETNLLDRSQTILRQDDAIQVANMFRQKEHPTATRVNNSISVVPIKSETGDDLIYVINYGKDNGYVLVGGTKNYQPILAYSENGHYNAEEQRQNENPFLNMYIEDISSVINIDSDSLRMKFALKWKEFENPVESILPQNAHSSSQGVEALKSQAISTYTNLGYECLNMSAVPYLISATPNDPNRAQNIINDICEHTHPAYDCMEDNLFLLKSENVQISPLLATNWYQHSYYPTTSNYCWGSVPIALAQIMYFYQWPTEINWSQIENIPEPSNLTPFHNLMDTVNQALQPIYHTMFLDGEDETYVQINAFYNGLNQLGYSYTYLQTNNISDAYEPLSNGIPLLCWGHVYAERDYSGHMWICDGYRKNYREYSFMIFTDINEYFFHRELIDLNDEYFHLNLCDKIPSSTWYYKSESIGRVLNRIIQITPIQQ